MHFFSFACIYIVCLVANCMSIYVGYTPIRCAFCITLYVYLFTDIKIIIALQCTNYISKAALLM